jgi:hypothetical protein
MPHAVMSRGIGRHPVKGMRHKMYWTKPRHRYPVGDCNGKGGAHDSEGGLQEGGNASGQPSHARRAFLWEGSRRCLYEALRPSREPGHARGACQRTRHWKTQFQRERVVTPDSRRPYCRRQDKEAVRRIHGGQDPQTALAAGGALVELHPREPMHERGGGFHLPGHGQALPQERATQGEVLGTAPIAEHAIMA